MKLDYQVHSIGPRESVETVKVNGVNREARFDQTVVELVRPGSALTVAFDDVEEAKKLFSKPGKKITLTFAGAK